MKRMWGLAVCLLGLSPAWAGDAGKPAANAPPKKACTLYNCCGCLEDKKHYENEGLWRLARACWTDLARYNVTENSAQANARCLDRAYADARKDNKIVLYIANTGG